MSRRGEWYLGSFEISRAGIYPKYPEETVLFFVSTKAKKFCISYNTRTHIVWFQKISIPPTDGQGKFLGGGGAKDRNFQGVWGCQREQFSRVIHKQCEIILICSAIKFETDALSKKKFKILVSNAFFFARRSRSSFGQSIIHFTFTCSAHEINQDGRP